MHTVVATLFRAHARARLRRMATAFSSPRRIMLSMLILVLAVVWTAQTILSMLLRDAYSVETFRMWVAVPLMLWFLWHIVRVIWKRPDAGIEWSQEEEALIVAGPFTERQQLLYRFCVILTATLPKVLLTIVVLWPDLSWTSPLGLVMAMVGLELFRMLMDVGICCLTPRGYRLIRVSFVAITAVLLLSAPFGASMPDADSNQQVVSALSSSKATQFVESLLQHRLVATIVVPFFAAADVIATHGTMFSLAVKSVLMLTCLCLMAALIVLLDSVERSRSVIRERSGWRRVANVPDVSVDRGDGRLPKIPWVGPLMWRQCRRALRFRGSLIISMIIPGLLLSPLMAVGDVQVAFFLVFAGALFYTFILLPEALKFDFRLDMDHLCLLKMLPMKPLRVVVGQLATPIVLACGFQLTILIGFGVLRSVDVSLVAGAVALSIPLTVLFVAVDNLTFLLYPHRPTQEGFEAFLRAILKFTGKTVLLTIFAATIVVWTPLAAAVAGLSAGTVSAMSVFVGGIIMGITGVAGLAVGCVVTAFRRFDVSLHAIS